MKFLNKKRNIDRQTSCYFYKENSIKKRNLILMDVLNNRKYLKEKKMKLLPINVSSKTTKKTKFLIKFMSNFKILETRVILLITGLTIKFYLMNVWSTLFPLSFRSPLQGFIFIHIRYWNRGLNL